MADEKLQYELTFKTRADTSGVEAVTNKVRDLRAEQERKDRLSTPEKLGVTEAAYYDLEAAVTKVITTTRAEGAVIGQTDEQRARALQTVRKIREEMEKEEAHLKSLQAEQAKTTGSYKNMGGAAAMAAFQVQDIAVQLQAGVPMATTLAQQLPQLLMIFGPGGAIAGGVIGLGALAYKLATVQAGTEEAEKAQAEYNEKLKELIALKADQFVDAYSLSIETAAAKVRALNDAEVEQLGTKAAVEAANRRIQTSQDEITKAYLQYVAAVNGVDVSAQLQQLDQRAIQRQGEEAIAAQTVRLEQQRAAYENVREEILRLKQDAEDWDERRQGLESKVSGLHADLRLAEAQRQDTTDITRAIAETEAMIAELRANVAAVPRRIEELGVQAREMGMAIDRTLQETEANIAAINAETQARASSSQLDAALQQNRQLVADLTATLEEVRATTPAQQQAAASIQAAIADGVLTAQELQQMGANLQNLMGSVSASGEAMNNNVLKLIQLVSDQMARQRDAEKKIEGLMNRQ